MTPYPDWAIPGVTWSEDEASCFSLCACVTGWACVAMITALDCWGSMALEVNHQFRTKQEHDSIMSCNMKEGSLAFFLFIRVRLIYVNLLI